MPVVKTIDIAVVSAKECSATCRASATRPAPSARATAEATPEPMPPPTTVVRISAMGKTTATAAMAIEPR
jgi:hypothetical protein